MERLLALLATMALIGCFGAGYLALSQFARAEDLQGLVSAGIMLASGLTAYRILTVPGGEG